MNLTLINMLNDLKINNVFTFSQCFALTFELHFVVVYCPVSSRLSTCCFVSSYASLVRGRSLVGSRSTFYSRGFPHGASGGACPQIAGETSQALA